MIALHLYDHRQSLEVDPNVAEISLSLLIDSLPPGSTLVSKAEATHCIVHLKTRQLGKLEGGEDLHASPDLQFILCLTRDISLEQRGFNELERSHKVCRDGGKRRYVLYARDVNALRSRETREAFYAMDEEVAEAVVKGEWGKVPLPLRRLFHRTQIVYLSALAILLQGYLAAHAEGEGGVDWGDADIREALVEMGWREPSGESAQIPNREVFGKSKETVCRKGWFLEPFASREADAATGGLRALSDLRAKVIEEWGGGDDCTLPEGLEKLFEALEDESLETIDSSKIVASAYLGIGRRLKQGATRAD